MAQNIIIMKKEIRLDVSLILAAVSVRRKELKTRGFDKKSVNNIINVEIGSCEYRKWPLVGLAHAIRIDSCGYDN